MAGELQIQQGSITLKANRGGRDINVTYFHPDLIQQLNVNITPINHLKIFDPNGTEQFHKFHLGTYGLEGVTWESIRSLTDSQKASLVLAALSLRGIDVLLLQKPSDGLAEDQLVKLIKSINVFKSIGGSVITNDDHHLFEDAKFTDIVGLNNRFITREDCRTDPHSSSIISIVSE